MKRKQPTSSDAHDFRPPLSIHRSTVPAGCLGISITGDVFSPVWGAAGFPDFTFGRVGLSCPVAMLREDEQTDVVRVSGKGGTSDSVGEGQLVREIGLLQSADVDSGNVNAAF